jgi:hypothetical protein
MNNLLFSLALVGENIYNGLNESLGVVWFNVLINFIGVLAIVVKIIETQNKTRGKIVLFAIGNYSLWIAYFVLNGNFTSAVVNSISFVQLLVFLQRGKRKWADSYFWLVFFLAVQVGASFFTWNGPFSLFSIGAGLLSTIAYFVIDEKLYRYFFLGLMLLWIGNGIVYFYPIALIHDVFSTVSIIIAIVRYNFNDKSKKGTATVDSDLK